MASNQMVSANAIGSSHSLLNLGENQLVVKAKLGHRQAFDALWQSYAKKILATTYRITKNREDAEDAFQDSLLSAFVHIQDFDGKSTFSTWLMRIAINSALMILRRKRAALELSIDDADVLDKSMQFTKLADRAPTPEMQYQRVERGEILLRAIRSLKPSIRRPLELQQLQQYSLRETADMMGVSVIATKSRIHHAKAQLRGSLNSNKTNRARSAGMFHLPPAA